MTKEGLLKALEALDNDAVVILMDDCGGWCNIGEVRADGSAIAIVSDYSRPFTSDSG